jgi:hypothetical protein
MGVLILNLAISAVSNFETLKESKVAVNVGPFEKSD